MEKPRPLPLELRIPYWFGLIFGGMYIVYALVSIILSFMDRTYKDLSGNFMILIYGIPFIAASIGLKNRQKWGWFTYAVLMVVVALMVFLGNTDPYNIIIAILALLALVAIMLPNVRKHFFGL